MSAYNPIVTFINGVPGSGKDELVKLVDLLADSKVLNVSSIDPIRELLGISKDDKRPETRKVLSIVGDATEAYDGRRSNGTVAKVLTALARHKHYAGVYHAPDYPFIIFIHTREQYMVEKISKMLLDYNDKYDAYTLTIVDIMMDRPEVEQNNYSNASDIDALNSLYEIKTHSPVREMAKMKYFTYPDENKNDTILIDNSGSLGELQDIATFLVGNIRKLVEV